MRKLHPVLPKRSKNVFLLLVTTEGQNFERLHVKFHSMSIHQFQFALVIVFVVL